MIKAIDKIEDIMKVLDSVITPEPNIRYSIVDKWTQIHNICSELKLILQSSESEVRIITHRLGSSTVVDKVFIDKGEGLAYVKEMESLCERMGITDISDYRIVDRDIEKTKEDQTKG